MGIRSWPSHLLGEGVDVIMLGISLVPSKMSCHENRRASLVLLGFWLLVWKTHTLWVFCMHAHHSTIDHAVTTKEALVRG